MSFFRKLERTVIIILIFAGTLALLFMMVLIAGNSLGRTLFKSPIYGAIEVAGLGGVIAISAAVALTSKEKGNVAVDVLMERLNANAKNILSAITSLLSVGGILFLLYAILLDAFEALDLQETTAVTGIPTFPFKIVWAIAILISGLYIISHIISAIKSGGEK